jgi:2-keto-3-deoxy-6-phosphogluconate aldolase
MADMIKKKILENKIVAIVRGISKDNMLKRVKALLNGGIKLFEVTYD